MSSPSHRKSAVRKTGKHWPLQDAKARFSELVRKAQSEGPQHVTIHGRDAVVVLSEAEYTQLAGKRTGKELVEIMAASPHKEIELEQPKIYGPVSRPIKL